jgi:hypothetical protein
VSVSDPSLQGSLIGVMPSRARVPTSSKNDSSAHLFLRDKNATLRAASYGRHRYLRPVPLLTAYI